MNFERYLKNLKEYLIYLFLGFVINNIINILVLVYYDRLI